MSEPNTKFLEVDYKRRAYDGKWMKLAKIKDFDNKYTFKTETGQVMTYIPTMWIIADVYEGKLPKHVRDRYGND